MALKPQGASQVAAKSTTTWVARVGLSALCLAMLLMQNPGTASASSATLTAEQELELANTIEQLERHDSPFSPALYEPIMQLAKARLDDEDYATAGDLLHRAQHITHRNEGVHTLSQLEVVQLLADIAIATGNYEAANLQHKFIFFVRQRNLNKGVPPIESWYDLAHWLLNTGQPIRARRLLGEAAEQAQHIDQQLYLALLDDRARKLQGQCCSDLLAGAINQAGGQSGEASSIMLAAASLAQADSFLLDREPDQAASWYLKAATLSPALANAEATLIPVKRVITTIDMDYRTSFRVRQQPFGDRDQLEMMTRTEQLEHEYQEPRWFIVNSGEHHGFRLKDSQRSTNLVREVLVLTGSPFMFDEAQLNFMLPNHLQTPVVRATLVITLKFDVTTAGKPVNIEVEDSTAPVRLDRLLKNALRRTVWRPRLVNGVPVNQLGVRLTQTFDDASRPVSSPGSLATLPQPRTISINKPSGQEGQ